jgi:hypothetical protein
MTTLTFKASDTDAASFRAAALEKRVSFSDFARDALRTAVAKKLERNDIITPGCVILDGPPLTTEQMHAAGCD